MSEAMNIEKHYTEAEAAEILRVKKQTMQAWRIIHVGPSFVRIGVGRGRILYSESALNEVLQAGKEKAADL